MSVPPSGWGEEYAGATGFTILGEETIDGVDTQLLSFVVPEVDRAAQADAQPGTSGGSTRNAATSSRRRWSPRVHYMHNTFSASSTCRCPDATRGTGDPGGGDACPGAPAPVLPCRRIAYTQRHG